MKRLQEEKKQLIAKQKQDKKNEKAEKKAAKKANKNTAGTGTSFGMKLVTAACVGLVFGACAFGGFFAVSKLAPKSDSDVKNEQIAESAPGIEEDLNEKGIPAQSQGDYTPTKATYVESDISEVVKDVMPSMVSIINKYTATASFFFGQQFSEEAEASGSGIIIAENDTELLIATNNHVVEDSDSLEVTFIDGSTAPARIKGTDSDMDLAVILVKKSDLSSSTQKEIAVATLGDSDNLSLGEPVIAIGNALGYGQSVTSGIVSALDRELDMEDGSTGKFIQTDAAINPGNSGGALLNMKGEVIGINSSKIGGSNVDAMGFAIPITAANPIIGELMEHQIREKVQDDEVGYMGISPQEVTSELSARYNIPVGVYVIEVEEGLAADKAGMVKGDIIVKLDGDKIKSNEDLYEAMSYHAAGTTVPITVMRFTDGKYEELELSITFGSRPKDN